MVMEYIEGETFHDMIQRRGPIPAQEAIPMFKQALLGIGYAHRMGIVHRDIKPSNIMVKRRRHRQGDGFRHRQGSWAIAA